MFHIENAVSLVNFYGKPKWLFGVLDEQIGSLSFLVRLEDGHQYKRYVNPFGINIPKEPIVTDSAESNHPLRNQG